MGTTESVNRNMKPHLFCVWTKHESFWHFVLNSILHLKLIKAKQIQIVLSFCKSRMPKYLINCDKILLKNNGMKGMFYKKAIL